MSKDNDIYVGNTDHGWFEFCSALGPVSEVNFWRPSRQAFKAIDEGGLFVFRRKSPINKLGGFGTLLFSGEMTVRQTWNELGTRNGVSSLEDFVERLRKYRKNRDLTPDTIIVSNLVGDPVFLSENDWADEPSDWSKPIVTGKSYSSYSDEGRRLRAFAQAHSRSSRDFVQEARLFGGFSEPKQAGYTIGGPAKVRLGQGAFRLAVLSVYENTCAVTGTSVPEVIEAAHIRKFSESIDNSITNGIALRKDIHALYDRGLLKFSSDYRVKVTEQLERLGNAEYNALEGRKLHLPRYKKWRPNLKSEGKPNTDA